MEAMTSEREAFEKWARGEGYALAKQDDNSYHGIGIRNAWEGWQARAHLAQPAQAVDVGAIRCIARLLRALSPDGEEWRSSNPNNATVLDVRKLADKLTAALPNANGKEGVEAGGIKRAAAYIQQKADDYAAENCGMEPDTGATTYRYGRAGEEYHHTLLEMVEELTALAQEAG